MAEKTIRIRAELSGDVTDVKALINHPMETGQRKDAKTGQLVPAHFIQEVNCQINGRDVMTAQWGPAVSKNPYLSFQYKGAKKGDKIKISWVDNKGDKDSEEGQVQ
jgi:sulfur-oxidizing protein SoxZ